MKDVTKKRAILSLILLWFIPQVYMAMDCLSKGPCSYDYRLGITFLILWDLLPSLFKDFWVVITFMLVALIAFVVSFFVSTVVIKEKRKF